MGPYSFCRSCQSQCPFFFQMEPAVKTYCTSTNNTTLQITPTNPQNSIVDCASILRKLLSAGCDSLHCLLGQLFGKSVAHRARPIKRNSHSLNTKKPPNQCWCQTVLAVKPSQSQLDKRSPALNIKWGTPPSA